MPVARLRHLVLVVVFGAGLGACGGVEEPEVTRTDEGALRLGSVQAVDTVRRSMAPNDRLLVLEGLRGSVQLYGADQENADLLFVRRGRGDSPEAARSVLEGISITSQGSQDEYVYTWTADDEDYASMDVRGEVPRGVALRIDRVGGPVRIDGVEGSLTIQHQHGSVDIREAAGQVRVDIQNGDVHASFRALSAEGPLHLETENGNVRVAIPPTAAVQVDARTDVGTIRTHDLSLSTERFAPVNAGAQYDAEMGAGGPTLELRTRNGRITLVAADTTRADTTALPYPTELPTPPPDTTIPGPAPDTVLPDTAADTTSL